MLNDLSSLVHMPVRISLPTVYNTALSYYEVIRKIAERTEYALELIKEYENSYKEYTDTEVAKVREEVTAELNRTVEQLQADYKQFESVVNANLVLFQGQINDFDDRLTNAIIGVNTRTDDAIRQNNQYILEEVGKGFVNLKVINYFTGASVTVQEMFDYLSQFHLENAITYNQMVAKEKTYNQLVDYQMSYTDLATNGFTIIV